jgi:hypothetical protein
VQIRRYGPSDGRTLYATVSADCLYLAGQEVETYRLSRHDIPRRAGYCSIANIATDGAVSERHIYVACASYGMRIVEASEGGKLREIGIHHATGDVLGVACTGTHAYLAVGGRGVEIVDTSDPRKPIRVGISRQSGHVRSIRVVHPYAYIIADGVGLGVLHISDHDQMSPVGRCTYQTLGFNLAVDETRVVFWADHNIRLLDISDSSEPREIGNIELADSPAGIVLAGSRLYVASYNGLLCFRINHAAPEGKRPTGSLANNS